MRQLRPIRPNLLICICIMGHVQTPTLVRDGYLACDRVHLPDAIRAALNKLLLSRPVGLSYNSGRRGMVFHPSMLTAQQWACIFPPEYIHELERYLGNDVEVLRTEVISVPAHSDIQHTHRDHSLGPRVSICVAISIDPRTNVGTLLIPGSHAAGDPSPLGELVPSATTYLMYDTHTFHAGCGNRTDMPNNSRIFVTFCSSSLTCKQKGALYRATGQISYKSVTFRSLLVPLPLALTGRHTATSAKLTRGAR